MNASKVVLGAMVGMATGAVLGVLFAPDKGSNTRKKLSKQGSRYLGTIKDTASEYVGTLEESFENARETSLGIADDVKDAVESYSGSRAAPVRVPGVI